MTEIQTRCTFSELKTLVEIVPNPKNANKHTDQQIDLLAKLIKFQGWRHPIIISKRSGFVVAGHARLEAAKKLGLETAPVDYQEFQDEAQEYAFLVSDNKIAELAETDLSLVNDAIGDLGPDFDLDLLGMPDFKVDVAEHGGSGDEDAVPEAPKEAITKPGDLYKLGNHFLMCGNSLLETDVKKLLPKDPVEFCFTSPPYSDMRDYGGDIALDPKELCHFLMPGVCNLWAVNLGLKRKDNQVDPYWDVYLDHAKKKDMNLLSWNVWSKRECGSIASQTAMFGISHEWIFIFGEHKKLNRTVPNKNYGELQDHSWIRQKDGTTKKSNSRVTMSHKQLSTVIDCTPQKARDNIDHPARFPVELPEQYILACTDKGQGVYDPFAGSGTTLIAAEKTNRTCYAMEIEPLYCDVIVQRWQDYTGQKAEHITYGV